MKLQTWADGLILLSCWVLEESLLWLSGLNDCFPSVNFLQATKSCLLVDLKNYLQLIILIFNELAQDRGSIHINLEYTNEHMRGFIDDKIKT